LDVQTFYWAPEKELVAYGKGPNATLSYVHHYLSSMEVRPKKLVIYADNCVAQNKNHYTIWFLHYLCYTLKWFEEAEMNFLVAGHTKFSPDRHFGYVKKELNKHDNVETFDDVLKIIDKSATKQKVVAVRNFLTNTQDIPVHDWKTFLSKRYRKVSSKLRVFTAQYFLVRSTSFNPEYRNTHDGEPMTVRILKPVTTALPELQTMVPEEIAETRIEDLKRVEKFISPNKLEEFLKGLN
jgi:hypothetical protein